MVVKRALVLFFAAATAAWMLRERSATSPSSAPKAARAAPVTSAGLPRAMHVPRVAAPLVLDGELTEPAWHATPVERFLRPDGSDGRPYSEVRFLWSADGYLHVGLYASDRNIVSAGVGADGPVWRGDSFHLVFSREGVEHSFDFGPAARGVVLTDGERHGSGAWDYSWQSGARVALDMDEGTVDRPSETDEEWVLEIEIPLASLGLSPSPGAQIDALARRCDLDARGGRPLESPCPEAKLALTFDP